ncbi:MAG TPA: class I SAM-dependent methyltransferase [Opitutaceae bacterium]|jgi:2-polyprenyl-3-methyl-5-hydroxy-6-metoxy-1,4-benzoquinol methylase
MSAGGPAHERSCWCGNRALEPFSEHYRVCRACGTLVSQARYDPLLYDKTYWTARQTSHHGLPGIRERARLDLPERCVHWLNYLLSHQLPPARVLEVGCAHGGYVALMRWAGFEADGTELNPDVAKIAEDIFGVRAFAGTVESLPLKAESFEVIVLNDVIEHLPDPLSTLTHCARLLTSGGIFVIQTPEYKEHLSYEDLQKSENLFLKHMARMQDEHLYLFSRRSAGMLLSRLGFPTLEFSNPVFAYDMFLAASRGPLPVNDAGAVFRALSATPTGRLVQALLDKAFESKDRWWAMQRLEAKLNNSRDTVD